MDSRAFAKHLAFFWQQHSAVVKLLRELGRSCTDASAQEVQGTAVVLVEDACGPSLKSSFAESTLRKEKLLVDLRCSALVDLEKALNRVEQMKWGSEVDPNRIQEFAELVQVYELAESICRHVSLETTADVLRTYVIALENYLVK